MNFIETRGNNNIKAKEVPFSEAILNPSASFGGLYAPKNLPLLSLQEIDSLKSKNYKQLTNFVLKDIFDIDIDQSAIDDALSLYDKFDDASNPVPIEKLNINLS